MQYKEIGENRIGGGETGKQLSVTIATRFDRNTASLLREVAREKGIGVTTLIRMWTLDRLKRVNRGGQRGALIGVSAWLGKDRAVTGEGGRQRSNQG
jgi:hypothetical protein